MGDKVRECAALIGIIFLVGLAYGLLVLTQPYNLKVLVVLVGLSGLAPVAFVPLISGGDLSVVPLACRLSRPATANTTGTTLRAAKQGAPKK